MGHVVCRNAPVRTGIVVILDCSIAPGAILAAEASAGIVYRFGPGIRHQEFKPFRESALQFGLKAVIIPVANGAVEDESCHVRDRAGGH